MEQVWPTVIAALITGAISGITFLAYKHPKAYDKLAAPVAVLLACFLGFGLIWNASNTSARYKVSGALGYIGEADKKAEAAIDEDAWSSQLLLIIFGGVAYLVFLATLPLLKKLDDEPDKKTEKEGPEKDG